MSILVNEFPSQEIRVSRQRFLLFERGDRIIIKDHPLFDFPAQGVIMCFDYYSKDCKNPVEAVYHTLMDVKKKVMVVALDIPWTENVDEAQFLYANHFKVSAFRVLVIPVESIQKQDILVEPDTTDSSRKIDALFRCTHTCCNKIISSTDCFQVQDPLAMEKPRSNQRVDVEAANHHNLVICKNHFVSWNEEMHRPNINAEFIDLYKELISFQSRVGSEIPDLIVRALCYSLIFRQRTLLSTQDVEFKETLLGDITFKEYLVFETLSKEGQQNITISLSWNFLHKEFIKGNETFVNEEIGNLLFQACFDHSVVPAEDLPANDQFDEEIEFIPSAPPMPSQQDISEAPNPVVDHPKENLPIILEGDESRSTSDLIISFYLTKDESIIDDLYFPSHCTFTQLTHKVIETINSSCGTQIIDELSCIYYLKIDEKDGKQIFVPFENRYVPLQHHGREEGKKFEHLKTIADIDIAGFLLIRSPKDYFGPLMTIQSLTNEFKYNQDMIEKVMTLEKTYEYYRKIRGDGNCYYRCIMFGLFEQLLDDKNLDGRNERFETLFQNLQGVPVNRAFLQLLKDAKESKWPNFRAFEMDLLHDSTNMDLILVEGCKILTFHYLLEHQDDDIDGITLRDSILASFPDMKDLEEYAEEYLLPNGISAEGPFVYLGLIFKALGCHGTTVFIDRRKDIPLSLIRSPRLPDPVADIHLLLRPGHYDLLYPKSHLFLDNAEELLKSPPTDSLIKVMLEESNILDKNVARIDDFSVSDKDDNRMAIDGDIAMVLVEESVNTAELPNAVKCDEELVAVESDLISTIETPVLRVPMESGHQTSSNSNNYNITLNNNNIVINTETLEVINEFPERSSQVLPVPQLPEKKLIYLPPVEVPKPLVCASKCVVFSFNEIISESGGILMLQTTPTTNNLRVSKLFPNSYLFPASNTEKQIISSISNYFWKSSTFLSSKLIPFQYRNLPLLTENEKVHFITKFQEENISKAFFIIPENIYLFRIEIENDSNLFCFPAFSSSMSPMSLSNHSSSLPSTTFYLTIAIDRNKFRTTNDLLQYLTKMFGLSEKYGIHQDDGSRSIESIYSKFQFAYYSSLNPQLIPLLTIKPMKAKCGLHSTVCFDEDYTPIHELYHLACDHYFHKDCLIGFLRNEIDKTKTSKKFSLIQCPSCIENGLSCNCYDCLLRSGHSPSSKSSVGAHIIQERELKHIHEDSKMISGKEEGTEVLSKKEIDLWEKSTYLYAIFGSSEGNGDQEEGGGGDSKHDGDAAATNENGRAVQCRCGNIFIANKWDEFVNCPYQCGNRICAKCGQEAHEGRRCGEAIFDPESVKELLPRNCPQCKFLWTVPVDCNHCICTECNHQFCYLCAAPHLPVIAHDASYHRPKCSLYSRCCDEDCRGKGKEIHCMKSKMSCGPCTNCRNDKKKWNSCTHSDGWKACHKCVTTGKPCNHFCSECFKLGKLCIPPNNQNIDGSEVIFYSTQQVEEVQKRLIKNHGNKKS